jgi:hypothetical protein
VNGYVRVHKEQVVFASGLKDYPFFCPHDRKRHSGNASQQYCINILLLLMWLRSLPSHSLTFLRSCRNGRRICGVFVLKSPHSTCSMPGLIVFVPRPAPTPSVFVALIYQSPCHQPLRRPLHSHFRGSSLVMCLLPEEETIFQEGHEGRSPY